MKAPLVKISGVEAPDVKKRFVQSMSIVAIAGFAGILMWSARAVFFGNDTSVYAENGLLEDVQVWFLAAAGIIYLLAIWCDTRVEKLILLFFALLCSGLILREVDVEDLNTNASLAFFGFGIGRNLTLGAASTAISVYAALRAGQYLHAARRFLGSPGGVLLMAAGACLVIGQVFEEYTALPHYVYFEELCEFAGYALIVLSSLAVLSGTTISMASIGTGTPAGHLDGSPPAAGGAS